MPVNKLSSLFLKNNLLNDRNYRSNIKKRKKIAEYLRNAAILTKSFKRTNIFGIYVAL